MTFTSITFLILFPVVILAYFLIPDRFRNVWLLLCSYLFYLTQPRQMILYLLFVSLVTYLSGFFIGKNYAEAGAGLCSESCNKSYNKNKPDDRPFSSKIILIISIVLLVSGLAVFKYCPLENTGLFMPVGISFFTFQSLSYIIDVYRKDVASEKNIINVFLFVSFFPVILSGPIQRGKNFIPQLNRHSRFDTLRARDGLFYMLWGYFLKVVIAGRIQILTGQVLGDYESYSGSMLMVAIVMYAFLIYCDFAGYSYVAIGAGRILGFDLGINFRQPYLANSIADFWRRWHISLSGWFRDYLYIPLGGSRKGTFRKYLNVLIVFAVSGIWHGNTLNFLIWGLLNGAYQVLGQVLAPVKAYFVKITRITDKALLRRILAVAGSFILLDIAWVFFAIPAFSDATAFLSQIATGFNAVDLINGTIFTLGLGVKNLLITIAAVMLLIIADIYCEIKKCDISGALYILKRPVRWIIYYGLVLMVLLSVNLSTTEFIYSQF